MTHEVIFAPEALADLFDLYDTIAANAGAGRAHSYTDRIVVTCRNLATFPERGTRRDDLRPGLRTTTYRRRVTIAYHMQARALRAAGCRRIFEEAASGGRWDRPELHRLLDHLREGDTLVVWKLDRLSRSLKDVLHIMERIAAAGAGFRSLTEDIDTTTPAGRMMMQMVASFAEFERAMIHDRTSAGLAAARAEGRVGGRRRKLDAAKRREIAESVISGRKTGAEMARLYNVSAPTVSRIVSAHRTGLADTSHAVR